MRQSPETWMIDGKCGDIIRLLAEAAAEGGGNIETETKGKGSERMTFKGAETVKRAARVLSLKGVATIWETANEMNEKSLAQVRLNGTFVAQDGSYVVHSIVTAAHGGMGRHYTVAITAATKIIYGLALQMATSDGEEEEIAEPPPISEEKREAWSEALHAIVVGIDRAQNPSELDATTKLDAWKELTASERVIAQQEGEKRHMWLTRYVGSRRK